MLQLVHLLGQLGLQLGCPGLGVLPVLAAEYDMLGRGQNIPTHVVHPDDKIYIKTRAVQEQRWMTTFQNSSSNL
jgi:hypothetical protein